MLLGRMDKILDWRGGGVDGDNKSYILIDRERETDR